MTASPMALVGVVAGVIAIGSTFTQWVFTYANMDARISRISEELARNFKEDYEKSQSAIATAARLQASVDGMNKLFTKIEVLEEKLSNIDKTLLRMERAAEKQSKLILPRDDK